MADKKPESKYKYKRERLIKKHGLAPTATDAEIEAADKGPLDFVYDEYLAPKGPKTQKDVTAEDMKSVDSALSIVGLGKKDTERKLQAAAEEDKYPHKPTGEQMGPDASLASKLTDDPAPIVATGSGVGGGDGKRTDGNWTPQVSAGGTTRVPDGLIGKDVGDVAVGGGNEDPMVQKAMFNLEQAVSDAKGGGGQGDDKFEAELQKIRESFSEAKSNLESRELAHTLADALTKLGAGWYGKKTGADLSNIKVTEHDFAKDLGLIQNELQTNLADLRDRRRENLQKNEKAADLSIKAAETAYRGAKDKQDAAHQQKQLLTTLYGIQVQEKGANTRNAIDIAQLQEGGRHNRVMEDIASDNANKQARAAAEGEWSAFVKMKGQEAKDYRKQWATTGDSVMKVMKDKNMDDDAKQAQIATLISSDLGVPPERAQKIASSMSGFVFKDIDQPTILATMDQIASKEYTILLLQKDRFQREEAARRSGTSPMNVMVVFDKDSQQFGYLPSAKARELVEAGKVEAFAD